MSPLKIQKSGTHAAGDFSLQFSGIEKYSLCRAIMPRPGFYKPLSVQLFNWNTSVFIVFLRIFYYFALVFLQIHAI